MHERYPLRVVLKDGTSVELRTLLPSDEERLVHFFASLPRECTGFLKDDVHDPAVVQRFVRNLNPELVWPIIALDDNESVVADATLHMCQWGWRRHIGEIRVVVAPEYQKRRLATSLIHELVDQASFRGLKKLEAQILDCQAQARRAFERLGFREEARLKDHALDLDGKPHDLVILTNAVDDLWRTMEDMISDMEVGPDGY